MPARLLQFRRVAFQADEFAEIRVWHVGVSEPFPEGVEFSYVCVRPFGGRSARVYGIDNAHAPGVHEHVLGDAHALKPVGWRAHLIEFYRRVGHLRGEAG